jgi:cytochrome bd-type quinol oxidase subunit 2
MRWLRSELQWIPRSARILAGFVYLVLLAVFITITWQTTRDSSGASAAWVMALLAVLAPMVAFLYVLLIGYIHDDARRRGMRQVLWTLLAIFVPNGVGILIYFLMRQKPQVPCHGCGIKLQPGFAFCPNCGASMGPVCPQCHRLTEPGWSNCANCGAALRASSPVIVPHL